MCGTCLLPRSRLTIWRPLRNELFEYFCGSCYSYDTLCLLCEISTLEQHSEELYVKLFHGILDETSCLYHILPPHNPTIIEWLRYAYSYGPWAQTSRFQNSFLDYALKNY
jgi:hypothetical protein